METGWVEVGNGCFARRYEPFDVTVGVVVGSDGLLLIDTRGSLREAREIRSHLAELSALPVHAVINTHAHFDHAYGNAEFGDEAPIIAHASVPAALAASKDEVRAELAADPRIPAGDLAELVIVPPSETFGVVRTRTFGDRQVELIHPGRGHTEGDVVVRVPDANVVFAGDLVEESGPPSYGHDSFPLEWPGTLEVVSGLVTSDSVVVPGHGAAVDQQFVLDQRADIAAVASTLQQLWDTGVGESEALAKGDWPVPASGLGQAVARGYAQLRSGSGPGRSLPMA